MEIKKIQFISVFLLLVSFISCSEYSIFTPHEVVGDKSIILEEMEVINQSTILVDPTVPQNIVDGTTKIDLEANCIYGEMQELIDSEYELNYQLINNKAKMIFNNISTNTIDQILDISFLFEINASKEEELLFLDNEKPIIARLPAMIDAQDNAYRLNSEGTNNYWSETQSIAWKESHWNFNGKQVDGYELDFSSFGIIAIGHELKNVALGNMEICINMPSQCTDLNTNVYIVFDDFNSVVQLEGDSQSNVFCDNKFKKPIGAKVQIISISSMGNNDYYFGSKAFTLDENINSNIFPEQMLLEDIITTIRNL